MSVQSANIAYHVRPFENYDEGHTVGHNLTTMAQWNEVQERERGVNGVKSKLLVRAGHRERRPKGV